MSSARYAVGIDLGTTNCVMAVIDLASKGRFPEIDTVPIRQRLDESTVGEAGHLPSFLYWPTDAQRGELQDFGFEAEGWVMGKAAAELGSRVKGRLISSAKSWLCHGRVDRTSKLLPWGAEEGVEKISPLKATTLILQHLKFAWEQSQWGKNSLAEQFLTITLPASFDQSARALTIQACADAGMGHARLLEEPQAAFYNWISLRKGRWNDALKGQDLVLVCDVGGGTSDFSLIRCQEDGEDMRFEREAVGDHLLLGGDNIDLALAHMAESHLSGANSKLNLSQWQLLSQLARKAKETLLSEAEDSVELRLPGAGRKVIGGLRKTSLKRKDVCSMVLEGFFPLQDGHVEAKEKSGLQDMGLPYESEPAITWHILDFIRRHGAGAFPGAVLFNGGSLEPSLIRDRVVSVLTSQHPEKDMIVLESDSLADAVARGAAYYGYSDVKGGLKVGGGSAQGYYLGLHDGENLQHLCLIPKGSEAHEKVLVNVAGLEVQTNEPVSFHLFQSDHFPLDESGQLRALPEEVKATGCLNTMVRFGRRESRQIPVRIEGELTELDTLQLELVSVNTDHRWRLEFDLRGSAELTSNDASRSMPEPISHDAPSGVEIAIPDNMEELVCSCFEGPQPKSPIKVLEEHLGVKRSDWNVPLLRALADVLLGHKDWVKKSPAYEATWLLTFSYAFRPGFGAAKDDLRRHELWSLFRNGAHASRDVRANSEWAILWRRIASSLEDGRQSDLFQRNKKRLLDKKGQPHFKADGAELWRMLSSMEAMPSADKLKLGQHLLASGETADGLLPTKLWCLSRLGTRLPLGGRVDDMLTGEQVSPWIEKLMAHVDWMTSGGSMALMELARRCGDRHLDISESLRNKVMSFLEEHGSEKEELWLPALERVTQRDLLAQTQILGEALPVGLALKR